MNNPWPTSDYPPSDSDEEQPFVPAPAPAPAPQPVVPPLVPLVPHQPIVPQQQGFVPQGFVPPTGISAGPYGQYPYSQSRQSPQYVPSINVQGATPLSSPQMTYTTPMLQTRNQQIPTRIEFPARIACPPMTPTYTAREMLDHSPVMPAFDNSSGTIYNSSAANKQYGPIAPLREWQLPEGLGGYENLHENRTYTPFPTNPMCATVTEADVISVTMNAIFNPVETVLFRNSYNYPIKASCEESRSISVRTTLGSANHLSRIDRSYSYWDGQRWVTFAIMEFKRPNALVPAEWAAAFASGNEVGGDGDKLCRQLKKYGYVLHTPFVGAFDGKVLLLLFLDGREDQWFHPDARSAPPTPGRFRWINDPNEMKRNAYVFLRHALYSKLRQQGLI